VTVVVVSRAAERGQGRDPEREREHSDLPSESLHGGSSLMEAQPREAARADHPTCVIRLRCHGAGARGVLSSGIILSNAMERAPERDRTEALGALFAAQRGRLWGLAYRMTGSAEDAEDVVQEAFARLLEREPARDPGELPFWLVRVATNLALDALRRRKRRPYTGAWLPAPVELDPTEPDPGARYEQVESATFAFLIALEALGPRQRAALLLRDVVGASPAETAEILGVSEANARVLHLRARRAMQAYDQRRCVPTPELRERHRAALEGFLGALFAQDVRAVEAWLAESARTVTDAGGEYTALAAPLDGRARVARFYVTATKLREASEPHTPARTASTSSTRSR
jgi:RNA polymerase sigma-70 factor (ECF subfamily)